MRISCVMLALLSLIVANCATPGEKLDTAAAAAGFTVQTQQGARFRHRVYRNSIASDGKILHVFIAGDGAPLTALRTYPPDPTPRNPISFRLMRKDTAPALLLGRPCYHGLFAADGCTLEHLGPARYSGEIVGSMVAVLGSLTAEPNTGNIVLIGHSGGGTLAMLIADRMPQIAAVVTLAGNLDVAAWAQLHHAPALSGSLDPAKLAPLPSSISQLHFVGEQDQSVPPQLVSRTLAQQGTRAIVLAHADHDCCWEKQWPRIVDEVARALATNAAPYSSKRMPTDIE